MQASQAVWSALQTSPAGQSPQEPPQPSSPQALSVQSGVHGPPVTHWPPPEAEVTTLGVLEVHSAALLDLGIGLTVYGAVVSTLDRLFPTFWSDPE